MNTLLLAILLLSNSTHQIIIAHSGHEKQVVKNSRGSAVYITPVNAGGHGTGTYVEIDGSFFVITAKHVTDDHYDYIVSSNGRSTIGKRVYESNTKDISVLRVGKIKGVKPIKIDKPCRVKAGDTVYFSGFPSHYSLLTTRAFISGGTPDGNTKYMQGLAWFGSSGSGVFNEKSMLCGVITAIAVERKGFFTHTIESLNYSDLLTAKELRNIRKAIGKR